VRQAKLNNKKEFVVIVIDVVAVVVVPVTIVHDDAEDAIFAVNV